MFKQLRVFPPLPKPEDPVDQQPSQSFAAHARVVPGYHYVTTALLVVVLGWSVYRLIGEHSIDRLMNVLLTIAIALVMYYARGFALKVQDRLIRLEERMRLKALCPGELHADIDRLTPGQLVALRFASDGEAAELAAKVAREGIHDKKQIKAMIHTWRPDYFRA